MTRCKALLADKSGQCMHDAAILGYCMRHFYMWREGRLTNAHLTGEDEGRSCEVARPSSLQDQPLTTPLQRIS